MEGCEGDTDITGPFYTIDLLSADAEHDKLYGVLVARDIDFERRYSDFYLLIGTQGVATPSMYDPADLPIEDEYNIIETIQAFPDKSEYRLHPLGISYKDSNLGSR
jgi:hypothetical protein